MAGVGARTGQNGDGATSVSRRRAVSSNEAVSTCDTTNIDYLSRASDDSPRPDTREWSHETSRLGLDHRRGNGVPMGVWRRERRETVSRDAHARAVRDLEGEGGAGCAREEGAGCE